MSADSEPLSPAVAAGPAVVGLSRRSVLAVGAAGAGALALAACRGGGAGKAPKDVPADQTVAALADIPVGQAIAAKINGANVIVARPTATTAACFSAICTHQGCTVQPAGAQLHCPCHGSIYNAVTGAVIQGPAPKPLPPVAVHVAAGQVVTGS